VPQGWAVTVSHFGTFGAEDFKVFVLCSRNSDAVIQAAVASGPGPLYTGAPLCPGGTRAIGGGVGTLNAVPAGSQHYITYSSHPVDETLTAAATVNGDIARAWATALLTQSGGTAPRFFSICSAGSDAKVRAQAFTVAGGGGNRIGTGTVTCPTRTRALAGGMGTDTALDQSSDRLAYTAPLDASGTAAGTKDGAIARSWHSAARSNSSADRTFRVLAICGKSEPRPDAHVKRSNQSAYTGMDVYSPTAQAQQWNAKRTQTRAFNLRFENDSDTDTFTVRGCATRKAMRAKYLDPSTGTDVTKRVTGDGFVYKNVPHRGRRSLVLRLTPTSSAKIGATLGCRVSMSSAVQTNVADAVTARVRVVRG
jgi:hypothetical protein